MSASRKSRRLKSFNPEEQPQIHQFIVNSGQSQTAPTITPPNIVNSITSPGSTPNSGQSQTAPTITPPNIVNSATPPGSTPNESKGKKHRRSTGEKITSAKKRNPAADQTVDPNMMAMLCYGKSRKWKRD